MDNPGLQWWRQHYGKYLRWADALVHVSEGTRRSLESHGILNRNTRVIYNGIDTDEFSPNNKDGSLRRRMGLNGTDQLIGYVGRLTEGKGVLDLVHAFAEQDPHTHLAIIGEEGIPEYMTQLHADIDRLGLGDRVVLTGFSDDVPRLIADLDILVLPSRNEGFGRVLVEAMSSCIAVVATDVGGIPEAVRDGVDGLLVPPQAVSDLAAAIRLLVSDEACRLQMGLHGRDRAVSEFSLSRQCRTTEAMYSEVCSRRRPR